MKLLFLISLGPPYAFYIGLERDENDPKQFLWVSKENETRKLLDKKHNFFRQGEPKADLNYALVVIGDFTKYDKTFQWQTVNLIEKRNARYICEKEYSKNYFLTTRGCPAAFFVG